MNENSLSNWILFIHYFKTSILEKRRSLAICWWSDSLKRWLCMLDEFCLSKKAFLASKPVSARLLLVSWSALEPGCGTWLLNRLSPLPGSMPSGVWSGLLIDTYLSNASLTIPNSLPHDLKWLSRIFLLMGTFGPLCLWGIYARFFMSTLDDWRALCL